MTQIRQTSAGTGLGLNAISVFTRAQAVDVSAADFVWQVNGVDPTLAATHNPRPYVDDPGTATTGYPKLIPFKLKVSEACSLVVQLEGDAAGLLQHFNEGENNQMVIKVMNSALNTLDGSVDGDITAMR